MMRLWVSTYAKPPRLGTSAVVSAAVHGGLIAAAIVATLSAPQRLRQRFEDRVVFLPPPNHYLTPNVPTETVNFVALVPRGLPRLATLRLKPIKIATPEPTEFGTGNQRAAPPPPPKTPAWSPDSVASVLEVDSAVERYPESAAPAYPLKLLAKHIEGAVETRYIVDTTGLADSASLVIVSATDTAFARSVREALPHMRFHPAILNDRKVRQLVSQTFLFKVVRPGPGTAASKFPTLRADSLTIGGPR